jgi:hypothetical protein
MPDEIGRADETPFDILNYFSARVQVRAEAGRAEAGAQADGPATISRPLFQTTPANLNQTTFFTTWGFDELGGEIGFDYDRTSVRAALLNGVVLSRDGNQLRASAAQGGPLTKPSAGPGHDAPDFQLFVNHSLAREGGGLSLHYYHGNLALPVSGIGLFFRNEFDRTGVYASYPAAKRLHLFAGYERGRDRTAAGEDSPAPVASPKPASPSASCRRPVCVTTGSTPREKRRTTNFAASRRT